MSAFSFITKYFSKEDTAYQDNFDGHYKYIKSIVPIPSFIRKIFGLPEAKIDRRKKRFGRIRANPFYYITFPMLFVFCLVFYAAIASFGTLVVYFNTNVYLNGLIISLMIFGILKTFHNSFMLYGTAMFLRKIEKVSNLEVVQPDDIYMLRRSLERQGELVNTIYMSQTIDNVEQFGHPNFNGMRSRLIKSKLGFRTAKNRKNVNFIAGILVMLGLLGTFLGLLGTIDAVGEAMNSMSNIGGESGEIGMEEMTGFIGSLAAPLQGMGLAFSSSLFGLSGSLLIGFFLHLAGTPQNEFIENVSRWIDDREQKFDPKIAKDSKAKVPPNDSDLKDWLSGYIHMSVKNNKAISNLAGNVSLATAETNRAWGEMRDLSAVQKTLNSSTQDMNENIKEVNQNSRLVANSIPELISSVQSSQNNVVQKIDTIKQDAGILSTHMSDNNDLMRQYMAFSKNETEANKADVKQLKELIAQSNTILNQISKLGKSKGDKEHEVIESLKKSLSYLDQGQVEVLTEMKKLLVILQQDPQMIQAKSLMAQLTNVLDDLNKKTKGLFSNKRK